MNIDILAGKWERVTTYKNSNINYFAKKNNYW